MTIEVQHRVNNFPIDTQIVKSGELETHLSQTYFNTLLFGHKPAIVAKEVLKLLKRDERKPAILGDEVSKIYFKVQ